MADPGKNAITTYIGDGVIVSFSVGFEYLQKALVRVSLDGVEQFRPASWDFPADTTLIVFVVAPGAGVQVQFIRDTPHPDLIVPFRDGTPILAEQLNRAIRQSLMFTEEVEDAIP